MSKTIDFSNWSPEDLKNRQVIIERLVKQEMPPRLAENAVDHWLLLLDRAPQMLAFLEANIPLASVSQYCFMQGFVAGTVSAQTSPNFGN